MLIVVLEKPEGHISLKELVVFRDYLFYQLTQALKRSMTENEGKQASLGFSRAGS